MKGFVYGFASCLALSTMVSLASDLMLPTDPRGLDDYLLQRQWLEQQRSLERQERYLDSVPDRIDRRKPC